MSGYDQWDRHVREENGRAVERARAGDDASVRYRRRDDADAIARALRSTGGPVPLGFRRGARLAVDRRTPETEWTLEAGGRGGVALLDASRRARLHIGDSCYVTYLDVGFLALVGTRRDDPAIHVEVVRLEDLPPLSDEEPVAPGTWRMAARPVWAHTFPVDLAAGRHPGLAGTAGGELRDRIQAVTWARVSGRMNKVHLVVDLATGDVEVSHLPWFNAEPRWDRGAQDVLRVVTPREGGGPYAEILRGGIAELTPDGDGVVEWVRVDPFWGTR